MEMPILECLLPIIKPLKSKNMPEMEMFASTPQLNFRGKHSGEGAPKGLVTVDAGSGDSGCWVGWAFSIRTTQRTLAQLA